MDIEVRVNYYLNDMNDIQEHHIDKTLLLEQNQLFNPNHLCILNFKILSEQFNIKCHPNFYVYGITLFSILKKFVEKNRNISKQMFLCRWGDEHENIDQHGNQITMPFFTKTRRIDNKTGVLLNFNFKRHWGNLSFVKVNDIDFHKKINKIVWRGSTTGEGNNEYSFKLNRLLCVQKYHHNDHCDIGFSEVVQCVDIPNKYVKKKMTILEQLKYKYILSIEGNDVASGLKWQLYSNSVVFMRKPRIISWAMEDKLIPYTHYIPVKDDFSDLISQMEFAEKNQELCKKIINNANKFISQFLDPKKEELIQFIVIKRYLELNHFH